jgi:hypothetical protein
VIDSAAASTADRAPAEKSAPVDAGRRALVLQRPLGHVIGWLVFSVGVIAFIFAGTVRVGAGHWLGQRLRVRVIWSRFMDFLADHGANTVAVGLVALMAVLTLLGSLALLWWVLGLRNGDSRSPVAPDEP